jgi:hypothetical protein
MHLHRGTERAARHLGQIILKATARVQACQLTAQSPLA